MRPPSYDWIRRDLELMRMDDELDGHFRAWGCCLGVVVLGAAVILLILFL